MAVTIEELQVTLSANMDRYNFALASAQRDTDRRLAAMDARFAQLARNLNTTVSSAAINARNALASIGAGIGAGLGANELKVYADAWTGVQRALENTEQVFGLTLASAQEMVELSIRTRSDLNATTQLYTRTAIALQKLNLDTRTAAEVTETFSKALKLGAATTSEQASVMLQFSQALTKGTLNGDEFRSIMENAGVVQEALTRKFQVSGGALLEMAANGEIGARDMVAALQEIKPVVDEAFANAPVTIAESWVNFETALTGVVGKMGETSGLSRKTAEAIQSLADNMEMLVKIVLGLGTALGLVAALLAPVMSVVFAIGALIAVVGSWVSIQVLGDDFVVNAEKGITLRDAIRSVKDQIASGWNAGSMQEALDFSKMVKGAEDLAKVRGELETTRSTIDAITQMQGGGSFALSVKSGKVFPDKPKEAKQNAYDREVDQIVKRTALLVAEALATGKSAAEAEKAAVSAALHAAAERAKIPVTAELRGEIEKLASAYGAAAAEVEILRAVQRVRDDTSALEREIDLTGLWGVELHRARIEQELLNEARRAGVELTAQRRQEISDTADAAAAMAHLRDALGEVRDTSSNALKGFINDLREGKSGAEALAGVLDRVAGKLLDIAADQAIEAALGGLLGKGGGAAGGAGFLQSLLGNGGASAAPAIGSWSTSVIPFAGGGVMTPGGPRMLQRFAGGGTSNTAAIFGEAGPEAAVPLPDGRRIPVELRLPDVGAAARDAMSAQPPQVSVALTNNFNLAPGVTAEDLARVRAELVQGMPGMVQQGVAAAFDRNARFARSRI